MKKKSNLVGILVLTVFMLTLFSSSVNADSPFKSISSDGFTGFIEKVVDSLGSIFRAFLGGTPEQPDTAFIQFLFFIIILAVVYPGIQRIDLFRDRSGASLIVAIVVALLSARFAYDAGVIKSILIPYSTLGAVILTIFPIFLFGMLVKGWGWYKKIGWILFSVTYFFFWGTTDPGDSFEAGIISIIYLIAAIISLIWIFIDERIQDYIAVRRNRVARKGVYDESMLRLTNEIARLNQDISEGISRGVDVSRSQERVRGLEKALDRMRRHRRRVR